MFRFKACLTADTQMIFILQLGTILFSSHRPPGCFNRKLSVNSILTYNYIYDRAPVYHAHEDMYFGSFTSLDFSSILWL